MKNAKDYPEVAAALESGGIYPEFYDPDHVVLMVSPQNDPAELRRLEEVLAALPRRQAIRQGPPQGAQKSNRTGLSELKNVKNDIASTSSEPTPTNTCSGST